jgi:hypothetical protein
MKPRDRAVGGAGQRDDEQLTQQRISQHGNRYRRARLRVAKKEAVTLLDERELTDAERAAIADEARPGVWCETDRGRINNGDGKRLDQQQTDILIVTELHRIPGIDQSKLVDAIGWPVKLELQPYHSQNLFQQAFEQRGGIHSEQLVRLLAFRAWGERDRTWRKRDTWKTLMDGGGVHNAIIYGFSSVSTGQIRRDGRVFVHVIAERGRRKAERAYEPDENTSEQFLDILDELDAELASSPTWVEIRATAATPDTMDSGSTSSA